MRFPFSGFTEQKKMVAERTTHLVDIRAFVQTILIAPDQNGNPFCITLRLSITDNNVGDKERIFTINPCKNYLEISEEKQHSIFNTQNEQLVEQPKKIQLEKNENFYDEEFVNSSSGNETDSSKLAVSKTDETIQNTNIIGDAVTHSPPISLKNTDTRTKNTDTRTKTTESIKVNPCKESNRKRQLSVPKQTHPMHKKCRTSKETTTTQQTESPNPSSSEIDQVSGNSEKEEVEETEEEEVEEDAEKQPQEQMKEKKTDRVAKQLALKIINASTLEEGKPNDFYVPLKTESTNTRNYNLKHYCLYCSYYM